MNWWEDRTKERPRVDRGGRPVPKSASRDMGPVGHRAARYPRRMEAGAPREPIPPVRYTATSDGVRLAYSENGDGSEVTIKVGMWLTHLEFDATNPLMRHWFDAMGERGRYVRYDARGCGLSEPAPDEISLDRWVDDLEAVVAAVSDDPVNVLGFSQGAAVAIAFAVRRPERVARLILHG